MIRWMHRLIGCGALLLAATVPAGAEPGGPRVDSAGMELEAPGPLGPLKGTYRPPAQGKPVALIIPGSGPTDRDGNNPAGLASSTYRLLAEGLAQRGIGTLRIDKRGMFGSAGAVADPNAVTIDDYVADIARWKAAALARSARDCVWLIGHSEGGLVALASAARSAESTCGVILLAAPGRPLGTLLREQITRNPANAPVAEEAGRHIARLEQGQTVAKEEINPLLLPLFAPQVQGFLIDAMARDPARLAGETVLPMLIVQGGSDLQVALADGQALAAARPDARLLVLDGVSHTLKRVEGEGLSANYRTYFDTALPLDPRVVDAVAEFMQQGSAAPADRAGMRRTR